MESLETGKSQENLRLSDLIDFCVHSAKLRSRVVATVAGHKEFSLFEDSLRGMPGVTVNPVSDADDGDEVWLRVQRIHEIKPPEPTRAELKEWISLSKNPNVEPSLKEVPLTEAVDLSLLQSLLADYKTRVWTPWAETERPRQKSIKLYSELFTLKQKLEGGIVDSQIELVWGVGVAVQKTGAGSFQYPIITKLVELHLDSVTGAIEIRPRGLEPRLELDAFADQANSAVDKLEGAWREFLPTLQNEFSPFDRSTYEPILNSAATFLDANGAYWPKIADAGDRALPRSSENLCVTDTWVLFARPRTNSAYLQDLERLKRAAENLGELPAAVLSLVKDSVGEAQESGFPEFRGVSSSYHSGDSEGGGKGRAQDLFFPKPFNDEQVRIIQLLEKYDGVVVQGPPGTGKTHTIANVICHYLANGKRVLVTSMKDPALGVLHGQLPDEIKPLAISLLSSEQEGMKKFEYSIQKIASEVQSINPVTTGKEIQNLEDQIHSLHGELMRIDHEISAWAKKNLEPFELGGEKLNPSQAASELVTQLGSFEYIEDPIDINPSFDLQVTEEDLRNLRQARLTLGNDIDYCQASLPQMIELPEAKALLLAHQDLSQFEQLKKQLESGKIPRLRDQEESTLQLLHDFEKKVESLQTLNDGLGLLGLDWVGRVRSQARSLAGRPELSVVLEMGTDLSLINDRRKPFLERPVKCPQGVDRLDWFFNAVKNLSDGGSAFGLSGLFGKKQEKDLLTGVSVLGSAPKTSSDWAHVLRYLENQKWMLAQVVRWNAVAPELELPSVPDEPSGALRAFENFEIFSKTQAEAVLRQESLALAKSVFPGWHEVESLLSNGQGLREIGRMVGHHLALQRLSSAWSRRESFQGTLQNHSGKIIESMRIFLNRTLGNPEVSDLEMQGQWSALTAELARVLGLSGAVKTVMRVTSLIEDSGAPLLATKLRLPIDGVVDTLLPVDFSKRWRMARVSTHLAKVDGQDHLKSLAAKRRECELTLGRAYQDVIVKRTWLKLTQNATDRVRQALQAYLSAIKKIGKGTGKRAVRYRQDARAASETANPAVPCWIMPHYRISESLPAELGCFDLVIIDEASQSDLTALPAILRAKTSDKVT